VNPSEWTDWGIWIDPSIINGEVDALKRDIDSGLDSNAVLKLGEKAASDRSLPTLAAVAC
jgi:hypothetical protein